MPRILVNGRWYDPVSAKSLYESDYEIALLANAGSLFAGFHCVPFKILVQSEYGSGKPDLALIDAEYRSWVVVEVELDVHPLKGHVEEQVRKFANGLYGAEHAEYIAKQAPGLDVARLRSMMLGEQPRSLVLVTAAKPDWAYTLAQYGASVGVIEMFRNDVGEVLFRVNGDQPTLVPEEVLSYCVPDRWLPKALLLLSPAPFEGIGTLDLHIEGEVTRWKLIRVSDAAWITPESRSPLDPGPGSRYSIVRQSNGELGLIER